MTTNFTAQSVQVPVDVPLGDILNLAGGRTFKEELVLPIAATLHLVREYGQLRPELIDEALGRCTDDQESVANEMALSEFMRLESYSLPDEWAWMDETFAKVEAAYRDRGVDLLRVGPSDVGGLVHDLASEFKEAGCYVACDLAEYRRRVAAFELEVLSKMGPDCEKVAQWPLSKMARQSEWLDELPFESRRRAAIEVADRLGHELDSMGIAHADLAAEAEARLEFLSAVHKRLEAEAESLSSY